MRCCWGVRCSSCPSYSRPTSNPTLPPVSRELRYFAYPPAGFLPASTPILYGPSWLAIASLLVSAGRHNPLLVILLFRGLALFAHLANTGLIWAILTITAPAQRLPGSLLYAWNPLVLLELAGNGHYDGLVICLLLLAIWLYVWRNHPYPVGAREVGMRGEGLYGRPPMEHKVSSPTQEDTAREQGTAGDHKGPPRVHPTTLAPTETETGTAIRWSYEIGALVLVGLAISMDWLALVIAPLFAWYMVLGRQRMRTALKGFGLRMLLVLFVAALTCIPVWQGGTTFLAVTSSIDLERLANSPLALLAAPLGFALYLADKPGAYPFVSQYANRSRLRRCFDDYCTGVVRIWTAVLAGNG